MLTRAAGARHCAVVLGVGEESRRARARRLIEDAGARGVTRPAVVDVHVQVGVAVDGVVVVAVAIAKLGAHREHFKFVSRAECRK